MGSNLVRLLLAHREGWRIVNVDSLTYASNPASLADVESNPRYTFVDQDITGLDQLGEDLLACLGLGVEGDAALVAVEHREVEAVHVGDIAELPAGDITAAG